jgi:cold shock CspA family protein
MQGTVKWFSQEKGFGFITSDAGQDHYFNVQSIIGAKLPSNGARVDFDPEENKKGPRAKNVIITAKAPSTQKSQKDDDRINCPNCKRKIVPRMITYQGDAQKTLCPYCAATVRTFPRDSGDYCFIATAVYADPNCYQVCELRKFRDTKLLNNCAGKAFVSSYYRFSPPIANWIKKHERIAKRVRFFLDILVNHIKQ